MLELQVSSPAIFSEGESYPVRLAITNQSFRGGLPVEVTLIIGISAGTDFVTLIIPQQQSEHFLPNETRSFEYNMSVPAGSSGQLGLITAWVRDPTDRVIASDTEDVEIVPGPKVNINPLVKLSDWSIAPKAAYLGVEFTVSVAAQGALEEPVSSDILLEWNGHYQVKNTGGLRVDDRTRVSFAVTPQATGTYQVKLNYLPIGTFEVLPVPVGPAPGWIEGGFDTRSFTFRKKLDWTIYSKGWRGAEWTYGANQFQMREEQLEERGVETVGCYGNREACIGRVGVVMRYVTRLQITTTTVVGTNREGYIIRNEEYNFGLNDPEARVYYEGAIPTGIYMVLTGQTSYPTVRSVLSEIESSGAGDVTNLDPQGDEASTWWAKLKLFDVGKFLDAIARLEWVNIYTGRIEGG